MKEQFTRQELQFLRSLLKVSLKKFGETINVIDSSASDLWKLSYKDYPSTSEYFKQMNEFRDVSRNAKEKMKKMATIQSKIKRNLS